MAKEIVKTHIKVVMKFEEVLSWSRKGWFDTNKVYKKIQNSLKDLKLPINFGDATTYDYNRINFAYRPRNRARKIYEFKFDESDLPPKKIKIFKERVKRRKLGLESVRFYKVVETTTEETIEI